MEGSKEYGKVLNNTVAFKVLTRQAAGIRRHAGSTGQLSGADNLYEQYMLPAPAHIPLNSRSASLTFDCLQPDLI